MRKLTTPDLFAGVRILKAYGLRESAKELAQKSNSAADIWDNGYEFMWSLFDKLTTEGGEQEMYKFLSGPFEMTPKEVQELPLAEMLEKLKQLGEENDLVNFFRSAAASMK